MDRDGPAAVGAREYDDGQRDGGGSIRAALQARWHEQGADQESIFPEDKAVGAHADGGPTSDERADDSSKEMTATGIAAFGVDWMTARAVMAAQ